MTSGSYLRFFIGLILSLTVLWSFVAREPVSALSAILSVLFLILAIAWAAFGT